MTNPELRPVFNPDVAPQLTGWMKQLREDKPKITEEETFSSVPKIHDWELTSRAMSEAGFDVDEWLRRRLGADQIRDGSM